MMGDRRYFVYIMTNKRRTVLYTGVTGNLPQRIRQHKLKEKQGFTKRYNVDRLVYVERYRDVHQALSREKQIKAGSRQRKLDLMNALNPEWRDLFEEVRDW